MAGSPRLGVGVNYLGSHGDAMMELGEVVDFFEITPDTLCSEIEHDGAWGLRYRPEALEQMLRITDRHPVVVHGVGLSIGSPTGWNESYLEILTRLSERRSFCWHSEHLAFMEIPDERGARLHTGIPLPLPFTAQAADMIAARAKVLQQRYDVPFLLENTAYYLPELPADDGWDESRFLNEVCRRARCGLLLDLYNLRCNCENHGLDPLDVLDRLDLDNVVEIHLASGGHYDGFLVDIHSEAVSDEVWLLLEYVLPRAPRLGGIVYELLDEALTMVGGVETIRAQLATAADYWRKARSPCH